MLANHEIGIFARQSDSLATLPIDGLDDTFAHKTREHHLDHFNRCGVCYALAVHKLAFDTKSIKLFVDHRPAAMNNDGIYPNHLHQNDISGELVHRRVITHCVAAEFHHHNRACVALQIGQCLVQCAGSGNPVSVHVLSLHFLRLHSVAQFDLIAGKGASGWLGTRKRASAFACESCLTPAKQSQRVASRSRRLFHLRS